jgi:hypothetical protein
MILEISLADPDVLLLVLITTFSPVKSQLANSINGSVKVGAVLVLAPPIIVVFRAGFPTTVLGIFTLLELECSSDGSGND